MQWTFYREEEKKLLKQENDMMVQKMMDDVVTYEKEREALAKKKKLFVEGINSQIKENHLRRQIEQEKINEVILLHKNLKKWHMNSLSN